MSSREDLPTAHVPWWRKRRIVIPAVIGLFLIAGVAIALFIILGGWSGSVTPTQVDHTLTVTAESVNDDNPGGSTGCSEGAATIMSGKIQFNWSPSSETLNGQAVEEETAPCVIGVSYAASSSNTDTLVLLGFEAPAGVIATPYGTSPVCGATVAPGTLISPVVNFETDGNPATFDNTLHGFKFADQASFDGSQCLAGWQ